MRLLVLCAILGEVVLLACLLSIMGADPQPKGIVDIIFIAQLPLIALFVLWPIKNGEHLPPSDTDQSPK